MERRTDEARLESLPSCVLDVHLWTRASAYLEVANCDFCGHRGDAVTLEALAEVVDYVVDTFYVTWSESGAFHDEGQSSELTFDILEVAEDLLAEAVDNNVRTALDASSQPVRTLKDQLIAAGTVIAGLHQENLELRDEAPSATVSPLARSK